MEPKAFLHRLPGYSGLVNSGPYRAIRFSTMRGPERRFTPPREDCEHPEWWTSTDGDSAELEVTELLIGFVRALQPEFVIETGTAHGQTAIAIGRALKRNGHGRLVTLETNLRRAEQAAWRCKRLPVQVVNKSSLDYEPPEPVDMAWFDSLLETRANEFRRYWPKMHTNTLAGFHDTGPHHPTRPLIDELETQGVLKLLHFATPRGVTFGQATGFGNDRTTRADLSALS